MGETGRQQLGIRQLVPGESGNTTVDAIKSGIMTTGAGHIVGNGVTATHPV